MAKNCDCKGYCICDILQEEYYEDTRESLVEEIMNEMIQEDRKEMED